VKVVSYQLSAMSSKAKKSIAFVLVLLICLLNVQIIENPAQGGVTYKPFRPTALESSWLHEIFDIQPIYAQDPVDALQKQIDDLEKLKKLSEDATSPLVKEVATLDSRVKSAQAGINTAKKNGEELSKNIDAQESDLAQQIAVFSYRVSESYKRSRLFSPLYVFLASKDAAEMTRELAYVNSAESQDRAVIKGIANDILALESDKKKLEEDQKKLAALQVQLDKQAEFFKKEIANARKYQTDLSGKIASLSAEQQRIIASKSGTATTSVGEVPEGGDPKSLPSYNPGFSPAFAVFSFGAPHFKGMSQYGAKGRAQSGQSYEQILKAYYGDIEIKEFSMPGSISTSVGTIPFEDKYLKGIAEMPGGWHNEALKAQAVAARSYALARQGWRVGNQNMSGTICVTEACQVYTETKFNAGGGWHEAVNQTKGKVVVSKATGEIISTMYSSTSGGRLMGYSSLGHNVPGVWDTTSDWSKWTEGAYEKVGGSPWFYKAWYKERSGDSCGREHPWLRENEMADILNSWIVRKSGSDGDRVGPLGSCWGGNAFSIDEMKNKANEHGGAVTSISSVKVEHSQGGTTSSVVFQTNKGELRLSGGEFKEIFNLRAPGRVAVKSNLYGIEKK